MASRRDGFWGIKIPGFFCPAGTYGMYGCFLSADYVPVSLLNGHNASVSGTNMYALGNVRVVH